MEKVITKDTLIGDLGIFYNDGHKDLEKYLGIVKVGDLAQYTIEELYNFGNGNYMLSFSKIRDLGRALHSAGLTYKNEYEGTYISQELVNENVLKLNLSDRVKAALGKTRLISTIGELATTPYDEIIKLRGIGDIAYSQMRKALAEVGVAFKWNERTRTEERDAKRFGLPLDLTISSPYIQRDEVSSISEDEEEKQLAATIQRIKLENAAIQARIKRKQQLMTQYQQLQIEKESLVAREDELDKELMNLAAGVKGKVLSAN